MYRKYRTVYGYGEAEVEINRSRFIGYAKPVDTEEEALEFIDEIKKKHYDATHNVYAYIIGLDSNIQRFSDDGEPSGTAGIPSLELMKKEGLVNTVVVGTRYFGGVKLGAGGLIRAYTRTAKIGVEAASIVDMVLNKILKIRLDYTLYGQIENFLLTEDYVIKDSVFDDAVNIYVYVEDSEIEAFKEKIVNLTAARAEIEEVEEEYIPMKDGKVFRKK